MAAWQSNHLMYNDVVTAYHGVSMHQQWRHGKYVYQAGNIGGGQQYHGSIISRKAAAAAINIGNGVSAAAA